MNKPDTIVVALDDDEDVEDTTTSYYSVFPQSSRLQESTYFLPLQEALGEVADASMHDPSHFRSDSENSVAKIWVDGSKDFTKPFPQEPDASNDKNLMQSFIATDRGLFIPGQLGVSEAIVMENLTQSLLENAVQKSKDLKKRVETPIYQNWIMAYAYLIALGLYFSMGVLALMTKSASTIEIHHSLFSVLLENLTLICGFLMVGLTLGVIWLFILKNFAKATLAANVVALPVVSVGVTLWMFIQAISAVTTTENTWFSTISFLSLTLLSMIVSLKSIFKVWKEKEKFSRSKAILQLSMRVLEENLDLIPISFLFSALWVFFSAFWLIVYSRIAIMGVIAGKYWQPNDYFWMWSGLAIVVFFWTAGLLKNLQRATTSIVVYEWYFQREKVPYPPCGRAVLALLNSCTYQFGSCSFAALVLVSSKWLLSLATFLQQVSKFHPFLWVLSKLGKWITSRLYGMHSLAISYSAMMNTPFLESVGEMMRLYRRNLIVKLEADSLIRRTFIFTFLTTSLMFGLILYSFNMIEFSKDRLYVLAVAGMTGGMQYYIFQHYAETFLAISEAVFLCWVMDLDREEVHCDTAHQIFRDVQGGV